MALISWLQSSSSNFALSSQLKNSSLVYNGGALKILLGMECSCTACDAILCMTSGPTMVGHCSCSDIVLFNGILHADSVREEDSQVIYS